MQSDFVMEIARSRYLSPRREPRLMVVDRRFSRNLRIEWRDDDLLTLAS